MKNLFKYKRLVSVDFEFCEVTEQFVKLVCCVLMVSGKSPERFWLHGDKAEQKRLKQRLLSLQKDSIFLSYAAVAEGRSFLSLGLDPAQFTWVDEFFEYRCLTNNNDNLLYGPQLVNGKVKNTRKPPPKWERTEEDSGTYFRPTHSLAEATFKLTGKTRDTEHKNVMRDLIISNPESFTSKEREDILEYCEQDVIFLPEMLEKILEQYEALNVPIDFTLEQEMCLRGKYAALTAKVESIGYPIDKDKTLNLIKAVPAVLFMCQRDINDQFPDIKPFTWKLKENKYSWNQSATKDWLRKNVDTDRWMKTDSGDLSLKLEAWERHFPFHHDFPRGNFAAQMVRYLKLKSHLGGFVPNKNGSFWDAVGSDGRVRPYTNPYGAQSSRSQQSSRSFLFLKTAWMRALCIPKKGKAIAGIDYGSQEFLVSALIAKQAISPNAKTTSQIEAYKSGDVYLAFGKLIGLIPPHGTKTSHKAERNLCKSAVLGMSYLMTEIGLSAKLTADTGQEVSEAEALQYINDFYEVFWELAEWQQLIQEEYKDKGVIKLPCGWAMWGDNDNFRSIVNVPIQGFGASVMRKAVEFCNEAGLTVIMTLHDALYIEYDADDLEALDKFYDCMKRAFVYYFEDKENASIIKMDPFAWSPDYEADGELVTPNGLKVPCSNMYIDERGEEEYKQFSKYFDYREENAL